MLVWEMMSFQEPSSKSAMMALTVYDTVMEVMIMMTIMISYMMIMIITNKSTNRFMLSNNYMEIIWTIIPMTLLMFMASPSLQLLYMMEPSESPLITTKVIGHQWYWSYEYPDIQISYDSYMTMTPNNNFRLLDVDNRMIAPFNIPIRILCTSTDVIHSWTLPTIGFKMDAVPGRINQVIVTVKEPGLLFGQCSEICGMNHSFMPVVMEVIPVNNFINWMNS